MIQIYYDWGRWVAECPRCHFAIQVPRTFTAFLCGHFPDGTDTGQGCGYRSAVQWPADINTIEQILVKRPLHRNRNWKPGESVADLRIENALHQLPSGDDL